MRDNDDDRVTASLLHQAGTTVEEYLDNALEMLKERNLATEDKHLLAALIEAQGYDLRTSMAAKILGEVGDGLVGAAENLAEAVDRLAAAHEVMDYYDDDVNDDDGSEVAPPAEDCTVPSVASSAADAYAASEASSQTNREGEREWLHKILRRAFLAGWNVATEDKNAP
jgi:hypothetical protein